MNFFLSINCAVFLLLCLSRTVSSGEDNYDPCKAPGFVNGDIALTHRDIKRMKRRKRAATALKHRYWNHGIVPYKIDDTFEGNQMSSILEAMKRWESHSCVTFVEHTGDTAQDHIYFMKGNCGCCSFVGRKGDGKQGISIGNNCDKVGIIIHELGHVLGFWHEHTRPDRNDHVIIHNDNIRKGEEHNFNQLPANEINSYGEAYDFQSIMHYSQNTFAKEVTSMTIVPRNISQEILPQIGQRDGLSKGDIIQINKIYRCPSCGGTLQKDTGSFRSPGKTPYTCAWRVSVNSGEVIELTRKKFDLKSSPDCENNYVEIREGHATGKLIGKYCGSNKPAKSITSSGNRLWVKARLREVSEKKGFIFNYKSVCGWTLHEDEGEIQSPGYPLHYEFNKLCSWRIGVKEGAKIGIKFIDFVIERSSGCVYDYMTVYDGESIRDPVLGRFCGKGNPQNIMSSSNKLLIQFKSDNSVAGKGFMLKYVSEVDECLDNNGGCDQICKNTLGSYQCQCRRGFELHSNGKKCEVACGGELKNKTGNITSPSYPEKYPENKRCIWWIRAPKGHQIALKFHDFSLERSDNGCQYDYLVVKNTKNSTRLCGDKVPDVMMSTSNEMNLEFRSDNSMSMKGFSASYDTDKDECQENNGGCDHKCVNSIGSYNCKCRLGHKLQEDMHKCIEEKSHHTVYDAPTGNITSPGYPDSYPSNTDHTWTIKVDPGHRVKLIFEMFFLEHDKDCKYDYVEVNFGASQTKKMCNIHTSPIDPIISETNEMELKFHSDASETWKGFKAVYETVCGGRIDAPSQTSAIFSHVYYGWKFYLPNIKCEWHLAAKSGYVLKMWLRDFEVANSVNCTQDYLRITDGSDNSAPLLGQVCGTQNRSREFVTTGNNMWLQFVTDDANEAKGFVLQYKRMKV